MGCPFGHVWVAWWSPRHPPAQRCIRVRVSFGYSCVSVDDCRLSMKRPGACCAARSMLGAPEQAARPRVEVARVPTAWPDRLCDCWLPVTHQIFVAVTPRFRAISLLLVVGVAVLQDCCPGWSARCYWLLSAETRCRVQRQLSLASACTAEVLTVFYTTAFQ